MMLSLYTVAVLSQAGPFPEDCSMFNTTGGSYPIWFNSSQCDAAPGGCFLIDVPSEILGTPFSVGNTSRTSCDKYGNCTTSSGHDTKWCIDHINGKIYTKGLLNTSVMYFEIDNKTKTTANAPSCRLLVGFDEDATAKAYDARTYQEDRLICEPGQGTKTNKTTYYHVDVKASTRRMVEARA